MAKFNIGFPYMGIGARTASESEAGVQAPTSVLRTQTKHERLRIKVR